MKKILGLVVSLTVIAGICAGVLAYINRITRGPIAEAAKSSELAAVKAVMPAGVEEVVPAGEVFLGKDAAGQVIGYAAKGSDKKGYGGPIELMVGFRSDRATVVCYRVLKATETPGLGMNLKLPEFADQFRDKAGDAIQVTKDGGRIEAITAATITSRAVCRAVRNAGEKVAASVQ